MKLKLKHLQQNFDNTQIFAMSYQLFSFIYLILYNYLNMNFDLLGLQEPFQNSIHLNKLSIQQQFQLIKQQLVPNHKNLNEIVRSRIDNILTVLLNQKDLETIQKYSRLGFLQETPLLRSHVWKLLLQSIPLDYKLWKQKRKSNYELYLKLLQGESHIDQPDLLEITENRFDQQLWNQIMLDSKRTYSMMHFFQSEVTQIKIYDSKPTRHYDILTRILYIWAKMNGGVRYVQGMNQILAPLYYLQFQSIKRQSQSQVFFMFSSLISPVIDMHIKDMDKSQQGIWGRMGTLNKYLKVIDYQLWKKLQSQGVNPQFYSFKWLALLLSQEFGLYQTMKIWDILLSFEGPKRFQCLYCFCISIIKLRKKFIMQSQFTYILPKLQKLKDLDITEMITLSQKIYEKLDKVDIDKILIKQEEVRIQKQKQQISKNKSLYKKTESIFKNLVIKNKK